MSSYSYRHVLLNRFSHLFPLVGLAALLILSGIPHLYYVYNGELGETMSLFGLLDNTYTHCMGFVDGTVNGSVAAMYFSYTMLAFWGLSWGCMVLYILFALFTALIGLTVWQPLHAGSTWGNTAKRCYRLFVPNSVCYTLFCLLPILPACFPYFFQIFCKSFLGDTAPVYYFGLPDPILLALICSGAIALFFCTRSAQKELRMELFRLYKVK